MKRLLLIAHTFPPDPSPGAQRPGYLAKYLPTFGWEVTPLTRSLGEAARPIRPQPAALVRRIPTNSPVRALLRGVKSAALVPDSAAPWIPGAIRYGRQLLAAQRFDAIFSTALPASVHIVAGALARGSGLPWIADYRDPWTGNRYVRRSALRNAFETILERHLLHSASRITTISPAIAQQLAMVHGRTDIDVIPNGYDPSEWEHLAPVSAAEFSLCYTGSMYDGKRTPDLLFAALAQLRSEGHAAGMARVHFYGPNSDNVIPAAQLYGIVDAVTYHGTVPRAEAMRAQRAAAGLLIFLNMDPATISEMGSKYLEYVGAGRPLIAFGPVGSVLKRFLVDQHLGWFASDVEHAKAALIAAHAQFSSGEHNLKVNPEQIPTASALASSFAKVLDDTVSFRMRTALAEARC